MHTRYTTACMALTCMLQTTTKTSSSLMSSEKIQTICCNRQHFRGPGSFGSFSDAEFVAGRLAKGMEASQLTNTDECFCIMRVSGDSVI